MGESAYQTVHRRYNMDKVAGEYALILKEIKARGTIEAKGSSQMEGEIWNEANSKQKLEDSSGIRVTPGGPLP